MDGTESSLIEQLRSTLGKLQLALGVIPEAIVWTDDAGRIQWCNDPFSRLIGRKHIEVLGVPLLDLLPLERRGEPVARDEHPVAHALEGGTGAAGHYELCGTEPRTSVEMSWAPFHAGQEPTSLVFVVRDVTERIRAATHAQRLHAELEAANRELESFSYSVAHDLRAPLRSIDGFSMVLLEDHGARLPPEARGYLDRVRAAAQRMARIIDDLLNLSRIGRTELWTENVDLSALAEAIVAELREANPERDAEVVIAPGLVARGDARLLRIVLENLLGNAWKFTARRARARIEVGVTEREGRRAFFVRDNGAGFDPAYAGKLFSPFQRLHGTSEFPGSGIGLATVQRIVQRHGGRVWADGAVEQGATFFFAL